MVQLLLILMLVALILCFLFSLKLYFLLKGIIDKVESVESDMIKMEKRTEDLGKSITELNEHIKFIQNQYLRGDGQQ